MNTLHIDAKIPRRIEKEIFEIDEGKWDTQVLAEFGSPPPDSHPSGDQVVVNHNAGSMDHIAVSESETTREFQDEVSNEATRCA